MKVTKKAVQSKYPRIIELGYCNACYLLRYQQRVAHTEGVYGWNADVFEVHGVAIVTGYRAFGNIKPDYALVEAYNEKARKVLDYYSFDKSKSMHAINDLLAQFITQVIKNH